MTSPGLQVIRNNKKKSEREPGCINMGPGIHENLENPLMKSEKSADKKKKMATERQKI